MNLIKSIAVSIGFGLVVSAAACGGMPDERETSGAATTSGDVPLTEASPATEETNLLHEEANLPPHSDESGLGDIVGSVVRWSGRFVDLGSANPSQVLATARVTIQPGESVWFSMSLNPDLDSYTGTGLVTPARLGVRVSWKWFANDFEDRGVSASPYCWTRTAGAWRTCTWTFTAPVANAYPSANGAYSITIQDRTSPDPGRNYNWAASMTKPPIETN